MLNLVLLISLAAVFAFGYLVARGADAWMERPEGKIRLGVDDFWVARELAGRMSRSPWAGSALCLKMAEGRRLLEAVSAGELDGAVLKEPAEGTEKFSSIQIVVAPPPAVPWEIDGVTVEPLPGEGCQARVIWMGEEDGAFLGFLDEIFLEGDGKPRL